LNIEILKIPPGSVHKKKRVGRGPSSGHGWITARQIEAARVTIVRSLKHEGRLWIRIFPDKPITKKPLETRMGKGKGEPAFWVAVVRSGRVLFEIGGIGEAKAREALTLASHKLPISVRFVSAKEVMV